MTITEALRALPPVRVAVPIQFPTGGGAGQRAAARRHLRGIALIRDAASLEAPLPLELDEVSATGAFVLSDLLLPVGAMVEMTFHTDDHNSGVTAFGRVVRVEERFGRAGFGIQFDRMRSESRAQLRAFTQWN